MRVISVLCVLLLLIGSAVTNLNSEDYERAITWLQNAGFLELQVSVVDVKCGNNWNAVYKYGAKL